MSRFTLVVCLAALAVAIGCGGDSPSSPSQQLPRAEYSQIDIRTGTGTVATSGRPVVVNYTGWIYDPNAAESKGRQFDSSLQAGRTPFQFTIGTGGVIAGWDRGVPGMRVGGLRRLTIPPELGYGSAGQGTIPGGATLVFDIELLAVN
jgi:FKBP-type peptidyl-prolyl cis-trans isomerase FkpA